MLRALVLIVLIGMAVFVAASFVPVLHFSGGLLYLLLVCLVIGLINLFVKPIVSFFSFPLIILTLGLFYLVINGLMLYLAAYLLGGLSVDGCVPAMLGGLVIALFNWVVR